MIQKIESKELSERILRTDPLTMAEAFRLCARDLFWARSRYEYRTATCVPLEEWETLMMEFLDKATLVEAVD